MSRAKRQHADVVSSVIERLETMSREEWQERLDRVAERFKSGASPASNGSGRNGTHAKPAQGRAKAVKH